MYRHNRHERLFQDTLAFYKENEEYGIFSNFARHKQFIYVFPENFKKPGYPEFAICNYAEKCIMLIKALLMDDKIRFKLILESDNPFETKRLGKQVRPWDQEKWDYYIKQIAYDVIYQKFTKVSGLKRVLLNTQDRIIVEASPHDKIWGIGLDKYGPIHDHSKWQGQNILGYALMEVREKLKSVLF